MAVHFKNGALRFFGLVIIAVASCVSTTYAQCPNCGGNPTGVSYPSQEMNSECPSGDTQGKCLCHRKRRAQQDRGPVSHCGMPAPQYPVPFATPRPTVPTYLWYPPMMPHNSLPHYRGTYSYRHAHGLSRTTVSWQPTYFLNAFDKFHNILELPR